jgi:two-component system nitrogen regulation response regulator GlnG
MTEKPSFPTVPSLPGSSSPVLAAPLAPAASPSAPAVPAPAAALPAAPPESPLPDPSPDAITVLVVDDERSNVESLEKIFLREGMRVLSASDAKRALEMVRTHRVHVVLTDLMMPGTTGLELLRAIKQVAPDVEVVLMTAFGSVEAAVSAMRDGAYDFVEKPLKRVSIVKSVRKAAERQKLVAENKSLKDEIKRLAHREIVGSSPALRRVIDVATQAAPSQATVLVLGESGTGKELLARYIHERSARARGPFVAVNCAAIPETILESELFGHEKGAFTGAQTRTPGRFEQAEGGTLFLDEIGDMPLEAQTRLLRVLQQGEYTTVGGRTPIKTNVRIIAATHRDLKTQIQQGLFREDLFYRLNVVPIRLPPLRERLEDVGDLVRHFLRQASREGLGQKSIESAAIERLKAHPWPGNVRELENVVRRLVALYTQDTLTAQIVEQELAGSAVAPPVGGTTENGDLGEAVERYLQRYFSSFGNDLPPPGLYDRVIRDVEKPLLSAALAATRGNQIRAAELLGLNRNTLRARIRDLNIRVFRTVEG